jgi:hypothetical protein
MPLFLTYTSGYQMLEGFKHPQRLDRHQRAPRRHAGGATDAHLGVLVMDHVVAARARVIATNPK